MTRYAARRLPDLPVQVGPGIAMASKLTESTQARWRAVNAPHFVALDRAGTRFEKGKLLRTTRP